MFFIYSQTGFCSPLTHQEAAADTKIVICGAVATLGDALLSITSLTIGILGALSIISGIPPAAAYTLIGISGVITLSWIAMATMNKGIQFRLAKIFLETVFSSSKI